MALITPAWRTSKEAAVVGAEIEWVGGEGWGVGGYARVHAVAVVEGFREGIGATELQATTYAAGDVDFQAVVGADAFGEPVGGVPDCVIGKRCVGWVEEGACRVASRARGGWADRRRWHVGVSGKQLVIAVGAYVADAKRGGGGELLIDL